MPDTIVIGTGISATAYLAALSKARPGGLRDVSFTGGPDLWRKMDPAHRMGQPEHLLTGNLLPGRRNFQEPLAGQGQFMTAAEFTGLLQEEMSRTHAVHVPDTTVKKIRRSSAGGYAVEGSYPGEDFSVNCERVVLAMGPGPARALTQVVDKRPADVPSFGNRVVGGVEFLSPQWTLPEGVKRDATIAVNGGSATAAWVVEQARVRGLTVVLWFTRPGGSGFGGAFPPGDRNAEVERETSDVRKEMTLVNVARPGERADRPLALTLTAPGASPAVYTVDLLVYALGSTHITDGGIPRIVDSALHDDLRAFYDHNRTIDDSAALLALGTKDKKLMIVGAAMFSKAGFGDRHGMSVQNRDVDLTLGMLGSYADISRTLPPAARPPEGIAMVMAGIEALTEFMPVTRGAGARNDFNLDWSINFNTSNRTQLAAWMAHATDLEPFAANLAVALIVTLRGGITLGLSTGQVRKIMVFASRWVRNYRQANAHMDAMRKDYDKRYHDDTFLNMHVHLLTTDDMLIGQWRDMGIDYQPALPHE